jgi:hypothetical protein
MLVVLVMMMISAAVAFPACGQLLCIYVTFNNTWSSTSITCTTTTTSGTSSSATITTRSTDQQRGRADKC